jgi:flavin-binding protein dodecin
MRPTPIDTAQHGPDASRSPAPATVLASRRYNAAYRIVDASSTEGAAMTDHVYKTVELTGSSPDGTDAAVRCAIERASKTIRDIRWFKVTETRGYVEDGKVAHWQVTLKVGFTLEE